MFILASQSPRRRMLLEAAGLSPKIVVPAIDESPLSGELPIAHALRVASTKARTVASQFATAPDHASVLAADTVVALDAEMLAKPDDAEHAVSMLERLSGRTHAVHTAVVLHTPNGHQLSDVVSTTVRFRALSAAEIRAYVATGEPMDKAGAYGIQGGGGPLVAEVIGSYTNVVGLPLEETLRMLRIAGIK